MSQISRHPWAHLSTVSTMYCTYLLSSIPFVFAEFPFFVVEAWMGHHPMMEKMINQNKTRELVEWVR